MDNHLDQMYSHPDYQLKPIIYNPTNYTNTLFITEKYMFMIAWIGQLKADKMEDIIDHWRIRPLIP